jgi:hypothetical protein
MRAHGVLRWSATREHNPPPFVRDSRERGLVSRVPATVVKAVDNDRQEIPMTSIRVFVATSLMVSAGPAFAKGIEFDFHYELE